MSISLVLLECPFDHLLFSDVDVDFGCQIDLQKPSTAKRIITAIFCSFEPVCNVIIIITGIICVFSMFGATAYPDCPLFTR